jgi:hypothetical protein
MVEKAKVVEQLGFLTDKISTQVRTVALGVLALAWGLLIGESSVARTVASQLKRPLLGIGVGAIVVMVLDFLQYVAGYVNTLHLLHDMERKRLTEAQWNRTSLSYRCRGYFSYAKQVALVAIVVWLLVVLAGWWLGPAASPTVTVAPTQQMFF